MILDAIKSGSIIRYSYLWERQADASETEGRKDRPTAVGMRMQRDGADVLILFPITSKPPGAERWAVEIPAAEKTRAGLDVEARLWIILDEANQDVVGKSYYLRSAPPLGRFSQSFFVPLMREVIARWRHVRRISRR